MGVVFTRVRVPVTAVQLHGVVVVDSRSLAKTVTGARVAVTVESALQLLA
jgi:hypothetical protein